MIFLLLREKKRRNLTASLGCIYQDLFENPGIMGDNLFVIIFLQPNLVELVPFIELLRCRVGGLDMQIYTPYLQFGLRCHSQHMLKALCA